MIEIENLTFKYESKNPETLRNINLRIGTGERVAIIGPSGVGKSTLLKCINQLIGPSTGSIKIDGEEILGLAPSALRNIRRKMGMVFQNFNLIKRISVLDNVLMGRLSYIPIYRKYLCNFAFSSRDIEIAYLSLKQVQMENFVFRRVDSLSGGQQQRVGIARVLAQEPKIILADEPVSNLDPKIKIEIMNLLAMICEQNNLILLISMHEINLAKKYVSRIIGLSSGEIIFDDAPEFLTQKQYAKIYN